MDKILQVGELAAAAGVSVRTLHHYQEIGLLMPLHRSGSGYRQYGSKQILRLQQITSLRQVGMSLNQIKVLLDHDEVSAIESIRMHVAALEDQIERTTALRDRLGVLLGQFESSEDSNLDDVLATLREVNAMSKHFTPEQIKTLKRRAAELGQTRIQQSHDEWRVLLEDFGRWAKAGVAANHPDVVVAARRARALVSEFSGGDEGIERGVAAKYQEEGGANIMAKHGWDVDPAAFTLMHEAMTALASEASNDEPAQGDPS